MKKTQFMYFLVKELIDYSVYKVSVEISMQCKKEHISTHVNECISYEKGNILSH